MEAFLQLQDFDLGILRVYVRDCGRWLCADATGKCSCVLEQRARKKEPWLAGTRGLPSKTDRMFTASHTRGLCANLGQLRFLPIGP
jgi:hypothetical protein